MEFPFADQGRKIESLEDEAISAAYGRGQHRYPSIRLSYQDFAAKVKSVLQSMPGNQPARGAEPLAGLHLEDLFLTLACSGGDRIAWECFVEDYLEVLRTHALRCCRDPAEGEDLAQEIVASMIGPERPKLSTYNGRGSLAGWLKVIVSHAAVDRFRKRKGQVSLEKLRQTEGREPPVRLTDSAEELMDARWGPVIRRLVSEKLESLSSREKLMLGLYYIDEVPLHKIAGRFGVHEATASRRLDRIRHKIRRHAEQELRRRGLRKSEIRSLWQWVYRDESCSLEMLRIDPGDR